MDDYSSSDDNGLMMDFVINKQLYHKTANQTAAAVNTSSFLENLELKLDKTQIT